MPHPMPYLEKWRWTECALHSLYIWITVAFRVVRFSITMMWFYHYMRNMRDVMLRKRRYVARDYENRPRRMLCARQNLWQNMQVRLILLLKMKERENMAPSLCRQAQGTSFPHRFIECQHESINQWVVCSAREYHHHLSTSATQSAEV